MGGAGEVHTEFWWGDQRKGDNLEGLGIYGGDNIIWIFKTWGWVAWTGLIWLKIGKVTGTCECGNEPSGSIKCGELLD